MNKASQRANREQWMGHVNAWKQSGLTQSAYCRLHGLVAGTFHAWVVRAKKVTADSPAALTRVPVVVQPTVSAAQCHSPLSLHHPSGWQLHDRGRSQLAGQGVARSSMMWPEQIYGIIEAVDMRRGIDGLSQWIQHRLGKTPCDGTV